VKELGVPDAEFLTIFATLLGSDSDLDLIKELS
jgi:hypothetical protein